MNDMRKYVSKTVQTIPPSGIRKFFDLVSQMGGVISLGVGEPDFVTPWHIREACFYSLEQGYAHVYFQSGLNRTEGRNCSIMRKHIGATYSPEKEILVTVGVSEAVDLALRAIIEPGDEVLVPGPSYVSYAPGTSLAYGVPVAVDTFVEDEYRLRPDILEKCITPKSKVLILTYPNNPTGGIMKQEDLQALVDLIIKNDLIVISDEIYSELTYNGKHVSIAALPGMKDRTVLISGMSKAFAMTGWRLVMPVAIRI